MKKWWLILCVALTAGCEKMEDPASTTSVVGKIYYASVESSNPATRTYLDEQKTMRWTQGDCISVFAGDLINRAYTFTGQTGDIEGSFVSASTDPVGAGVSYAVYPYADKHTIESTGELRITIPQTQTYAPDTFGQQANYMVAVTEHADDDFFSFKNLGGYIKFSLYGDNVTVKQIAFQGNEGEPLAGVMQVKPIYGAEPTWNWDQQTTQQTVLLDCGEGVRIGSTEEEATPFWLVVPPTAFTKGFTLVVTDTEGNRFVRTSSKRQEVLRNVCKNMPALQVEIVNSQSIPTNQIWYTASSKATPMASAFGATITNHSYDAATGQGIITFSNPLRALDSWAFEYNPMLKSVILPRNISSIGEAAFRDCFYLTTIDLPESLVSLKPSAFSGCMNLLDVNLHNASTIASSAFSRCASLNSFHGKLASDDGRCVISNNTLVAYAPANQTSFDVPQGIQTIGSGVFEECVKLQRVTLPNTVKVIDEYAFYGCENLTEIELPDQLTTIGVGAFWNCQKLNRMLIPNSVLTIGEQAFNNCQSMTEVVLPSGLTLIGASTFERCMNLAAITLPESITEIGTYAFYGCQSLTTVSIPKAVATIGTRAFSNCTKLESVYSPRVRPATGGGAMFDDNAPNRKIYVLSGSVRVYQAAEFWDMYASDIVAMP